MVVVFSHFFPRTGDDDQCADALEQSFLDRARGVLVIRRAACCQRLSHGARTRPACVGSACDGAPGESGVGEVGDSQSS